MKLLLTVSLAMLTVRGVSAQAADPVTQALAAKSTAALQAGIYDQVDLWLLTDLKPLVTADQVPALTPQQALAPAAE